MYTGNTQVDSILKKTEAFFDQYLGKQAPSFPDNLKQGIVQFGPWILVVLLIIGFFGIFAGFGLMIAQVPALLGRGLGEALVVITSMVLTIGIFILQALAVPGLFKTKKNAWYMVYYATLLGFVQALLVMNILFGTLFTILGLYILFQIKSFYKN